jgi:hypothetical protein
MLCQRSGHIVNISTSVVDQPIAGVPCALQALTKGGLHAVTRALAIEYAGAEYPHGRSGSFCGYCRSHCCPVLGSMADRIHFRRLEVYFDDALQSLRRAWH